jgi:hypothetical protein
MVATSDHRKVVTLPAHTKGRPPRRQPNRRHRDPAGFEWGPPLKPKNLDHGRFLWLTSVAQRWDLQRADLAVAIALFEAFRVERDYAEIGYTALAKAAGCQRRTAIKAIQTLIDKGLLESSNPKIWRAGKLSANRYRLINRGRGLS